MQLPPDRLLLFFEAESQDKERWAECQRLLYSARTIVLPSTEPKPATEVANDEEYLGCNGLLMLRHRAQDDIGRRVKHAYLRRRQIFVEKEQSVPWAILDDLGDPPPESETYGIPCVQLSGDWIAALQKALSGA